MASSHRIGQGRMIIGHLTLYLLLILSSAGDSDAATTTIDSETRAFCNRFDAVNSVVVRFHQETVYTPLFLRPSTNPSTRHGYVYNGLYAEDGEFRFLRGEARYDVSYAPITVDRFKVEKVPYIFRTETSFSRDRVENFYSHGTTGHGAADISASGKLPTEYPIDIAVGVRCAMEQVWLDRSRLELATHQSLADGRIIFSISNVPRADGTHRWTTNPTLGYAIEQYEFIGKDGFVSFEMTCADFHQHLGVYLPDLIKASYRVNTKNGIHVPRKFTISVSEYDLSSSDNVSANYHISYPSRTLVADRRFDTQLRSATTRQFSDKDIYTIAKTRDAKIVPPRKGSFNMVRIALLSGSIFLCLAIIVWYCATKMTFWHRRSWS